MVSPYLMTPRRPEWKALADTSRADYFRWSWRVVGGADLVLSVGKAYGSDNGVRHAASADTCEALLWRRDKPRLDLMPEEVSCLLEPWQRFFEDGIALNMPDSILTALVFALDYYFDRVHFGHNLLNSFYKARS